MKKQSFTLIEMLVVIAIISILAAMMLPNLQNAVRASRTLDCKNRMRQIGLTLNYYSDDYHGFIMPLCNVWSGGVWGSDNWLRFSMNYTLSGSQNYSTSGGYVTIPTSDWGLFKAIYTCPSSDGPLSRIFNVRNYCQYALNNYNGVVTQSEGGERPYFRSLARIKSPSRKAQLGEYTSSYVNTGYSFTTTFSQYNQLRHMHGVPDSPGSSNKENYLNAAKSFGVGNIIYADGHASQVDTVFVASGTEWKKIYYLDQ